MEGREGYLDYRRPKLGRAGMPGLGLDTEQVEASPFGLCRGGFGFLRKLCIFKI